MVVYTFSPSTEEAEVRSYLWVQSYPGLHNEFQDSSQGYVMRPY